MLHCSERVTEMRLAYAWTRVFMSAPQMRMHERRGIVHARIAGAKAAQGSALVVLDSHVEVGKSFTTQHTRQPTGESWLVRAAIGPRHRESRVNSLSTNTWHCHGYSRASQLHRHWVRWILISTSDHGDLYRCHLSFRWVVVEQAELTGKVSKPDPIPSPSMAGGLFTVDRQFFWDIGGYDEEFVAWGAENVEMALRTWMCGGRVECTPCAKTYHIYRKG